MSREEQIAALVAIGIQIADAQNVVAWAEDNLPPGMNALTWLPDMADAMDLADNRLAVIDARSDWYLNAKARHARLLDAAPPGQAADGALANEFPGWSWDASKGTYVASSGAEAQASKLADDRVAYAENAMQAATDLLSEKRITAAVWMALTALILRRLHIQLVALGSGGIRLLSQAAYAAIAQQLTEDYAFLRRLAGEIEADAVTPRAAAARMSLYVGQARTAFYLALQTAFAPLDGGATLSMRTLGVAEHCSDCVAYHEAGWQRNGALPPPGSGSQCLSNCRCRMSFMVVPYAEVDAWISTRRTQ